MMVIINLFCVNLVQGKKSSKEKFAGSLFTTTVEAFVPTNGRGIQVSLRYTPECCMSENILAKKTLCKSNIA